MTKYLKAFLQCVYAGEYLLKSVEPQQEYKKIDEAVTFFISRIKDNDFTRYLVKKGKNYLPSRELDEELEEIIDEYDSNRIMDELIETLSENMMRFNDEDLNDEEKRDSYRELIFNEIEENGLSNIGIIG